MAEERIGDFMIRIGVMTPEQVQDVLDRQKKSPGTLFGVLAVQLGYLNDKALRQYVEAHKDD